MKCSRSFLAGAAALCLAASAQAQTVCSVTDITPTAQACAGFYNGNLLNGSPADLTAQTSALALLGFAWDGNFNGVEKVEGLNGSQTVDFTTLLQGISYVAFHFGNGQGGPGNATAFYRLDAGAGVDVLTLAYNASSNAVLYSTQVTAVPEPQTYALMLAGLGVMGFMASRRRQA
ncbi:MAG: PEP-CTERM sorting domain-containing protein [Rhizobiales bacterium]|nr:PEP-CTERM sorting domain-containing protein [Rhizobacter sp.]